MQLTQDIVSTNDATKFLLSCGDSVNALLCQSYEGGDCHYGDGYQCDSQDDEENPRLLRERDIMRGVIDHLLPKIGPHVEVLDLAHGKSLTGEMVSAVGMVGVAWWWVWHISKMGVALLMCVLI